MGLGTMVVPLDSALNIAFPAITAHFGLALPEIQWIVICYVLTYGSLMLGIGRLGDIFGHLRVFRAGLAWSAVAYLACAWAPDYGWLLACRVLQGIGAALVISCGPALVTGWFPEPLRPRVLGLYTLMFAAGSVLGPSLGGLLVAWFGWEAVFWFRSPIALLALLLLRGGEAARPAGPREPFDLAGAVLLALAIGSLLLAINRLGGGGLAALPLAALFLAALLGFLRQSRRSPRPLIALGYFRLPGFAALNIANALVNLAGFAVLLFVPYYLTRIAGLPVALAGLVLAASPAGAMLVSAPGGWLLGRVPARRMAGIGIGLVAAGLGLMALWGAATPLALLVLALLLHGAGLGLLQVSYTDSVTATLPRQDRGVAGSLAMMTRTLGVVTAASLLTLVFAALEAAALAGGAAPGEAFLRAFRLSFLLAAAIPAAVLLLAVIRRG
ncbi:MFS transporter [Paeniroseomonas aquatica]|uniref:MFS transporter n=1 Tax=Paeniroseomonas aquatica TaxID=373043 RepID=A0ABT8A4C3_9PROT|nr:MFS transporter [Paeniroseomonas aquatica]MDN3564528.1 MFS transporter [Paeniroseomonas aquatica]